MESTNWHSSAHEYRTGPHWHTPLASRIGNDHFYGTVTPTLYINGSSNTRKSGHRRKHTQKQSRPPCHDGRCMTQGKLQTQLSDGSARCPHSRPDRGTSSNIIRV